MFVHQVSVVKDQNSSTAFIVSVVIIFLIKWIIWNKCQRHKSVRTLTHIPNVLYTYHKLPNNNKHRKKKIRNKEVRINLMFSDENSLMPTDESPVNIPQKTNLVHPENQC